MITALTPREREVDALVAEGLTNVEIAERLDLSPGTVANHLAHSMRALGGRSRVDVAVWAVERGLYRSRRASEGPPPRPYRSGRAEDSETGAS